jgi:formylglycine-generating enzyme required for sulfatase activity
MAMIKNLAKHPVWLLAAVAVVLAGGVAVYGLSSGGSDGGDELAQCTIEVEGQEVFVRGGTFQMGTDNAYPEERPRREVTVGDFWIDTHEVTNAEYAAFVEETGYVTVAERVPDPAQYPDIPEDLLVPGSVLFIPPTDLSRGFDPLSWWRFMPGANWREPEGPGSSIEGLDHYPVVHVAYEDALAYAEWAGRNLPTEAEWEYAARGGLDGAPYAWGDALHPDGKIMANNWQGIFPVQNTEEDGFRGLAPVGCFPANGYGLHDMIGNVWEWTTSPYNGGEDFRVIKGGSFLCAPNYCMRYRPSARQPGEAGLGTGHTGFRTVRRN